METLKFKTNIKCGGCIATVTPHLDTLTGLDKWEVDTTIPEKILTVTGNDQLSVSSVVETLKKAGFEAKLI